jgi:hypothetical protein
LDDQFYIIQIADQKATNTNIDTHPIYEITCTEIMSHYFSYRKLHPTIKCIAWASMDGSDSNNGEVNAATIHEIHTFIVIVFLRMK